MAYLSSVAIDTIIVIETLDKGHTQTGRDLFDSTIAPAALAHGMVAELYRVQTRAQFRGALDSAFRVAAAGHSPLIHIEAHGSTSYIEMASGETLLWSELALELARINKASGMHLLVVAATCHGWYLANALRPASRSPVWGVLGPPSTISAGELYDAMKVFYSTLIGGNDLGSAIFQMNGQRGIPDAPFMLSTAELLYCQIFQEYLRQVEAEPEEERMDRLVAELAQMRAIGPDEEVRIRKSILEELRNHKAWFDKFRTQFLMLDLFPENASRFQLSFDDCSRPTA